MSWGPAQDYTRGEITLPINSVGNVTTCYFLKQTEGRRCVGIHAAVPRLATEICSPSEHTAIRSFGLHVVTIYDFHHVRQVRDHLRHALYCRGRHTRAELIVIIGTPRHDHTLPSFNSASITRSPLATFFTLAKPVMRRGVALTTVVP